MKMIPLRRTAATLFTLFLFGLILYFSSRVEKVPLISTQGQSYERAQVMQILEDNIQEDGNRYGSQKVLVKMKSGAHKGEILEATSPNGSLFGADCTVGMSVIILLSDTGETQIATVYSMDRLLTIGIFLLIFCVIVCLIGGKKGAMAILGLIFTFLCIWFFMFPMIYRGFSPILLSIGTAALSTLVTLTLLGGFTAKTVAAILGTVCGVTISALSALIFGHFAGISGHNVSEIETLYYVAQFCPVSVGQLLFAGIIIASLGAVMDVGMSIASTLQEIHETAPDRGRRELFKSGLRVGRDMMGTMTNTLILAYAGGSITTLVINYAYDLPFLQLINSYNMGIEIMQGLSGSLGVVLTVPCTAFFCSVFLSEKGNTKPPTV